MRVIPIDGVGTRADGDRRGGGDPPSRRARRISHRNRLRTRRERARRSAVARIFAAKGRPAYNPLIVHVRTGRGARPGQRMAESALASRARILAGTTDARAAQAGRIPDIVTAGLRLGRAPGSGASGGARPAPRGAPSLAAPSANRSMALSPTTAQHVARSLGDAWISSWTAARRRSASSRRWWTCAARSRRSSGPGSSARARSSRSPVALAAPNETTGGARVRRRVCWTATTRPARGSAIRPRRCAGRIAREASAASRAGRGGDTRDRRELRRWGGGRSHAGRPRSLCAASLRRTPRSR